MSIGRIRFLPLLKAAVLKWNADNCVRLGASLSYYTLFSLFPLILVVLTIIRLLFTNSDAAQAVILDALASVTGGFRDDFVATLNAAIETRRASGIIGSITLIVGASWVFGELVSAFNIIWGVEAPERGGPLQFMRTTIFSLALVLAGAFLLLVSMILSAVLTALGTLLQTLPGGTLLWSIVHFGINLCILTLIFALLLKYLPQTDVEWRDVWLGATLTGLTWTILQLGISYYIAFSKYQSYGAVGAIMALVVWVYLSSQILFLGGEVSAVYAQRYGSRQAKAMPMQHLAPAIVRQQVNEPSTTVARSTLAKLISGALGVALGVFGMVALIVTGLLLETARSFRRLFWRS